MRNKTWDNFQILPWNVNSYVKYIQETVVCGIIDSRGNM